MVKYSGCRSLLQCLLKFLNFWLALVGAAMILFAVWMLNKWNHFHSTAPAPSPIEGLSMLMNSPSLGGALLLDSDLHLSEFQKETTLGPHIFGIHFDPGSWKVPAPWFIYCFMGIGIAVCLLTCSGHIAAEASNGCYLSCYTVFIGLLIVLQAAFAADIYLNKHWQEDFPNDPTGEFLTIKQFVKENIHICKWVGLTVLVIEVLLVVLAMCLKVMVPNSKQAGYDSDDECSLTRSSTRQHLLNNQGTQETIPNAVAAVETWSSQSDAWRTRLREKYGLGNKELDYDIQQCEVVMDENKSRCTIM